MLSPRLTITLPPVVDFPIPYIAFEEGLEVCDVFISFYFYFIDSDLNKFTPVPLISSFLEGGRSTPPLTESNEVILKEFFAGKFTFLLDPGLALISGKKPSLDFSNGSEVFWLISEDFSRIYCF